MKKGILATLTYTDIFDYPLNKEELFQWQINNNGQWLMDNGKCEKEIENLVREKKIETKNGFYFLPGRMKIVETRKRREGWSKIKLEKAKHVAFLLKFLPWIKFIGISGGLARNNAEQNDDIDFFFITERKRIWLSRALIVLFLTFFGWYRRPKNISDKICPNFFIDEAHLEIKPHDLYTAHEIAQVRALVKKGNSYQKFLLANSWVKDFLPNILKFKNEELEKKSKKNKTLTLYPLDILEKTLMELQLKYMDKRKTTEITSSYLIKFHPSDIHNTVLEKYSQRMASDI